MISLSPGRSRVYVSQWWVPSLLVLNREGDSISSIGRAGGGPGEFSGPVVPHWVGDTLWVADIDRTIVRFDSLGNLLAQHSISVQPLGPYQLTPRAIAPLPNGLTLFKGSAGTSNVIQGRVADLPFVRVTPEGEVLDTVAVVSEAGAFMSITWPDGTGLVGNNLFWSAPRWAVSPSDPRLVIADFEGFSEMNPFFRVSVIAMTGDTILSEYVPSEAVPVTEAHLDRILEDRFSFLLEDGGISWATLRETVEEQVQIPAVHPPVSSVLISRDGSVWLQGPHQSPDSITVTVLRGEDLSVLGRVALPSNVELLWVGLDEVWGRAEGRWSESYVLRFEPRWDE